jgi:hypothetical protein
VLNTWHGSTARRDPATRKGLDLVVDAGKRPAQWAREDVLEDVLGHLLGGVADSFVSGDVAELAPALRLFSPYLICSEPDDSTGGSLV